MIAFLAFETVHADARDTSARVDGFKFLGVAQKGSAGSVCNTRTKVWNPTLFTAHGD